LRKWEKDSSRKTRVKGWFDFRIFTMGKNHEKLLNSECLKSNALLHGMKNFEKEMKMKKSKFSSFK
jgi:hypothetical protein